MEAPLTVLPRLRRPTFPPFLSFSLPCHSHKTEDATVNNIISQQPGNLQLQCSMSFSVERNYETFASPTTSYWSLLNQPLKAGCTLKLMKVNFNPIHCLDQVSYTESTHESHVPKFHTCPAQFKINGIYPKAWVNSWLEIIIILLWYRFALAKNVLSICLVSHLSPSQRL